MKIDSTTYLIVLIIYHNTNNFFIYLIKIKYV
jgi:hypothetical protein